MSADPTPIRSTHLSCPPLPHSGPWLLAGTSTAEPSCSRDQRRYVLIAAILASSLGFIDGSVVSIAIPAIRENLSASLSQVQWINNSYLLVLSALILTAGTIGDRFGLRRVFGLETPSVLVTADRTPEVRALAEANIPPAATTLRLVPFDGPYCGALDVIRQVVKLDHCRHPPQQGQQQLAAFFIPAREWYG